MKLHHIGYIVEDAENKDEIDPSLQLVRRIEDPLQHAVVCLYKNSVGDLVELITPLNEASTVWGYLKKHGNKKHHKAYEGSLNEIENYTSKHHLYKIMGPVKAKIFNDQKVVFFVDKQSQITEFVINEHE